jgi:hypothetical protein
MKPGDWKICQTNYPHPTITTGQHTNGPAAVWVEVDGEWIYTGSHCLHRVMRELKCNGIERIKAGTWDGR